MSAPTFGRSVRLSTRCCDRTKSVQRRKPGEPHCGDHGARAASCFRASVAVSHRPGPDRDPMSRQQSLRHERPPAVLSPDLCPLATEDRETLHKDGGPGSSFLCQSRLLDIRRQPRFPRESECVPRTRGRTVLGQPLAGSGGNRFSGEAVGGEPLDGKTLRQISFVRSRSAAETPCRMYRSWASRTSVRFPNRASASSKRSTALARSEASKMPSKVRAFPVARLSENAPSAAPWSRMERLRIHVETCTLRLLTRS